MYSFRPGGYLFVWVYALEDHLVFRNDALKSGKGFAKHVASMALHLMDRMIRPWLSRSPSVVQNGVIALLAYVRRYSTGWAIAMASSGLTSCWWTSFP